MLEPYGLVAMLLGLAMAAYTFREYRRKRIGATSFLVWMVIWLGLMFTGIYPGIYLSATSALGMATPIQFVTTFSIIVLFAILYHLYKVVGEINRRITKIVQRIALESTETDTD